MHGIVHQSLKRYVVEKTDERSWATVLERSGIEPKLYLPVTHYDDAEFDTVLETVATMSGHDRAAVERDVGRFLAEPLLRTFRGHIRPGWDLLTLLTSLGEIAEDLRSKRAETEPPTLSCERISDGVRVGYASDRDYCALAHGVLEGIVTEYGESGTVEKVACVHEDRGKSETGDGYDSENGNGDGSEERGEDQCVFHVVLGE
ncbi:heme NO-binding domain-containing protein [Halobacteria archaeon AArc-m2/3/4]|uniref:Heme NO-binding domain-containing protein n=1 Tax=Natronoglomus mannanivorans TaxID=2979990 RepID=A0AAP3E1L6_9EURY|nr:heme NO-binding domain-containing protein [Halobacteria archaeon AArc-xg1-1]MCU4972403.1 heme NO-binding domain-containing protein [Halobacteria archaeon AArc-m2/3/4]